MPRKKNDFSKKERLPQMIDGAVMPMLVDAEKEQSSFAASTISRRETLVSPLKSFPNIDNTLSPFQSQAGEAYLDTREAIRLSVKAYWAFPLLRNVVEVMGELANSEPYLKGGSKSTREFIQAWWSKINLWQLKEQFFREWFRSGNVFMYRFDGEFVPSDIKKMTQVYGSLKDTTIPIKFIILNPEGITASASLSFESGSYFKVLSPYELAKLRNPRTPEDKQMAAQLDPASLKEIQSGQSTQLKLDPSRLNVMLYKAQPYEPMGVPMCYGVLNDIEAKLELKRIDLSIARTTDRALLLITVGETPNQYHKGGSNINPNTIAALQQAFSNESVARTLIADYTVSGDWLIPDINKILGPEKYAQIDKDINTGLNAILFSEGEKFANTSIKVQIFIERLKDARNAFLRNFLQPEINRICRTINAKSIPQAVFEDLSLKDELQYSKIYTTLAQFGLLTPEELFEAMESGKLPINEESIENQRKFKELKDEGLYLPLIGGASQIQKEQLKVQEKQVDATIATAAAVPVKATPAAKPVGRPAGSKAPKSASAPSPIGTSKANVEGFSLSMLKEKFFEVSELHNKVDKALKKNHKLKKLNEFQQSVSRQIVEAIVSNESQENWDKSVAEYLIEPKEMQTAIAKEIEDMQLEFNIDSYTAAILRLTKKPIQSNES